MAEQELAEDTEAMAAAMAAAAISDDIEAISTQREASRDQAAGASAETGEAAADSPASTASTASPASSAGDAASTYLMVKELRAISRARSLRLQAEDVIPGDQFNIFRLRESVRLAHQIDQMWLERRRR